MAGYPVLRSTISSLNRKIDLLKKAYWFGLFYIVTTPLILTIHRISPTNMAGFGWDVVVFALAPITSIIFLILGRKNRTQTIINLIGMLILIPILYYVMTKPGP
jgi:hypothetical protein